MKRTVLLVLIATLASLALAAFTFAQPTPSIPHFTNLQGRATDNVGNPVSDGAHTFTFRIFNVSIAGAPLWTEGPLGITTTGGLFTHQLGSSAPFPITGGFYTIFSDETQLWLEIEVDGNIISPRTQLITTPYTQVANFVETDPQPSIGIVTVRIPAPSTDCHISTYGIGAQQKSQLGNCAYGELLMWGGAAFQDVALQALGGGQLTLGDGGGINTINLQGGLLGDASVLVPTDAVNSGEILDEPGIAHSFRFGATTLTGLTAAIESVSITYPTSGFVVLQAHGYFYFTPFVTGTVFGARAYIHTVPGSGDFDNFAIETIESSLPSYAGDQGYRSFSLTKVEAVSAGTVKYYLNADRFGGAGGSAVAINRVHLTAQFFPTNYGTVISTKPVLSRASGNVAASLDAAGTGQPSEAQVTTVADHNARLEAERAKQMAELEARIKALEAQTNTDRLPERGMVGPRKER